MPKLCIDFNPIEFNKISIISKNSGEKIEVAAKRILIAEANSQKLTEDLKYRSSTD